METTEYASAATMSALHCPVFCLNIATACLFALLSVPPAHAQQLELATEYWDRLDSSADVDTIRIPVKAHEGYHLQFMYAVGPDGGNLNQAGVRIIYPCGSDNFYFLGYWRSYPTSPRFFVWNYFLISHCDGEFVFTLSGASASGKRDGASPMEIQPSRQTPALNRDPGEYSLLLNRQPVPRPPSLSAYVGYGGLVMLTHWTNGVNGWRDRVQRRTLLDDEPSSPVWSPWQKLGIARCEGYCMSGSMSSGTLDTEIDALRPVTRQYRLWRRYDRYSEATGLEAFSDPITVDVPEYDRYLLPSECDPSVVDCSDPDQILRLGGALRITTDGYGYGQGEGLWEPYLPESDVHAAFAHLDDGSGRRRLIVAMVDSNFTASDLAEGNEWDGFVAFTPVGRLASEFLSPNWPGVVRPRWVWLDPVVESDRTTALASLDVSGLGNSLSVHVSSFIVDRGFGYRETGRWPAADEWDWNGMFIAGLVAMPAVSVAAEAVPTVSRLELYPNPATNRVVINLPATVTGELSVYDLLGRRVLRQAVRPGVQRLTLDVAKLPAGPYFMHIPTHEARPFVIRR